MANIVEYILSLKNNLSPELENADKSATKLEETIKEVGSAVAAAFAIEKIFEFGNEILHTTAEFQGFDNVIKFSSLGSADAKQNLDYLQGAIKRLHLPIKEATEAFAETQAGMYGTGIEGQKLRDMFEGISTASTVLHLSADKFSHVTFALKEIGELGTLQARQMRMLAFALPGAMELAASTMHMSTGKFHEAMEKGLIKSSDFLVKFGATLKNRFSSGLANAGNSLISNMNDTQTAFIQLKLKIGEDFEGLFVSIMQNIISFIDVLKSGVHQLEIFGSWINKNKQTFVDIGIVIAACTFTIGAYLVITKASVIWAAIQQATLLLTAGAFTALGTVVTWVNSVFIASPIGWIVLTVGALTAGIIALSHHFGNFGNAIKAVWNIIKDFGVAVANIFKGLGEVILGTLTINPSMIKKGFSDSINAAKEGIREISNEWNNSNAKAANSSKKSLIPSKKAETQTTHTTTNEGEVKTPKTKAEGHKTINIHIAYNAPLIKDFTISTTNIKEGLGSLKDKVSEILVGATHDTLMVADY